MSRRHKQPLLTKKMVAVLALISAAAVIITAILFLKTNVITSYELPMAVQIVPKGSKIGFNLATDVVQFGKMTPGGENTRYFNATNGYDDRSIKVVLKASGDMARWVVFTPPVTYVPPRSNVTITVACVPPSSTQPGNYTGTLQVFYMKDDR